MMSALPGWRLGLLLGSLALAVGGLGALIALTGAPGQAVAEPSNDPFSDAVEVAGPAIEVGERFDCFLPDRTSRYELAPSKNQARGAHTLDSSVPKLFRNLYSNPDRSSFDQLTFMMTCGDGVGLDADAGATGHFRAGRPHPDTSSGPVFDLLETGSISGTVTPLPDICVNVYDTSWSWLGSDLTSAAGDYTVGGLPAGSHKVEFFDCGYPTATHISEWHNDKRDFDSADPVAVTQGVEASGVNAALAATGLGDVNCDGLVNVVDALFVLQGEVGLREPGIGCPLPPPPPDTLNVAVCDVNDDAFCNVVDALFILQCEVGISNSFCPLPSAFNVSLDDTFFEPNVFTVGAGQLVTFDIINDGVLIHNMHIAGPDGEYGTADDIVSTPDRVSPGETAVLEWTAPEEPGIINFRCDFHPGVMVGTITVQ